MENPNKEKIREQLRDFPSQSGVYLMKNPEGKIIYIGKAKNLKNRVRSYFSSSHKESAKTIFLVRQIKDIDYIVTQTEVEAFLLEASLIKKHRPKYNIRLKDDKSYPYIRLSLKDRFPRLYLARRVVKDGSVYFGPYTNGFVVRQTIQFLNETFFIRDCEDGFMKARKRPCLTYEIGRCQAPCVDFVNEKQYARQIQEALEFLRGENQKVIKNLESQMKKAAKEERFEQAAKLRDSLAALKAILEKQAIINATNQMNQDAIGFYGDRRGVLVASIHVRQGRVIGQRTHFLPQLSLHGPEDDVREWLVDFLNQYYYDNVVPEEVLLPVDLGRDLTDLLQKVLFERSQHKVVVRFATDELGRDLTELANKNAKTQFASYVSRVNDKLKALEYIQKKFKLSKIPHRMECYDISNLGGQHCVGSQVVFVDGGPLKEAYRRYKIKTISGANDYAALKEVLLRRFRHTEYEDPDLVLVDGGKGQLNRVVEALKEIGRKDIAVAAIAKSRVQGKFSDKEIQATEERFFLPGQQNPITFARHDLALQILVNLRDEAHRFAITSHRKQRQKELLKSALDEISGIGPERKKTLLDHFGSVEKIAAASVDEISSLPGFTKTLATEILEVLSLKKIFK